MNEAGSDGALYGVNASLVYELDLSSRQAGRLDAANHDASARAARLVDTRLLVSAELARDLFRLRALDRELVLVRDAAASQARTLELTEHRRTSGLGSELDAARAAAELAEARAEEAVLLRRRELTEHAIAVLVGIASSRFTVPPTHGAVRLPAIPAGIPATVLARRADISAARSALTAAQARAGIARSAWLPNLSLTAGGGVASSALGELLRSSARAWSLGALLALPLFDGGRRRAEIEVADAEVAAQAEAYAERVLIALREVEDQLSALRRLAEEAAVLEGAIANAKRTVELAASRYRAGVASQLEVLDAQRGELRIRRRALGVQASRQLATVGLIHAIGGGWSTPAAVTPLASAR